MSFIAESKLLGWYCTWKHSCRDRRASLRKASQEWDALDVWKAQACGAARRVIAAGTFVNLKHEMETA